jgi:hypothetical protein
VHIELASHDLISSIFELVSHALGLHVLLSFAATTFACVRLCAVEGAFAILNCSMLIQEGCSTGFYGQSFLVGLGLCDDGGRFQRDDFTPSLGPEFLSGMEFYDFKLCQSICSNI